MSTSYAPLAGLPRERASVFDPPPVYRRLQATEPVSPLTFPDGRAGWLVTRYDDVRALLADPRMSSQRSLGANPIRLVPEELKPFLQPRPGQFIGLDPPEHTRYRRLLTGQFTVRRMNALQPRVTEIVDEHLQAMRAAGAPADLVSAFALPVPSLVICELLGVPYVDRAEFQQRSRLLLSLTSEGPELLRARGEFRAYMLELVRAKRAAPGKDLLSGLVHLEGPDRLNDEELINIGLLLLIAGHETTANMLGLGTFALLQHPAELERLRADPALVNGAVEELLRYLTIVQFGLVRVATEDVVAGGHTITRGDAVVLSLPAANRDPAHFPDPDRLDLGREYAGHLAFGHGVHQCLGQQLARVEMHVGFTRLLAALPGLRLAVPAEQVRMRDEMFIYGVEALPVTWKEAA
ncbi:cytochrome P450 [Oryzihumus sp.]